LPVQARSPGALATSRALQKVPLLGNDQHCLKLIGFDLLKGDPDADLQHSHEVQRAPDQEAFLRRLGGVELVQEAVVAPVLLVRSVRAETGIAQLLAAQGPMHKEAEKRIIRPLSG
jgi:hypothetical protein